MNAPHKPVPDTLRACQDYAEALLHELSVLSRRHAQVKAELATERDRWARLKMTAIDADRMGHTIDVVSHMRAIEADTPSVPVLMIVEIEEA